MAMTRKHAALIGFLLLIALAAGASEAPAPPCGAAPYHALDFWIGRWDVKDAAGQPAGTSLVEAVSGGCGLVEHWTGAPGPAGNLFLGAGLHFYEAATGAWRQVWTDNRPAVTEMKGSGGETGFVYTWDVVTPQGQKLAKRYTLSKTPGGVRQLGERSADGGATWVAEFDLRYAPTGR
jgi:hypothetical protein